MHVARAINSGDLPTRKPDEPFLLGASDVLRHSLIYDSVPLMALLFEWDAAKARTNLKKHGVAFEEATTIFGDPNAITIESTVLGGEHRFVTIGYSNYAILVVVVHTVGTIGYG